ncbi:hypothetical protein NKH77_18355 [Streptomyces sp. M19]
MSYNQPPPPPGQPGQPGPYGGGQQGRTAAVPTRTAGGPASGRGAEPVRPAPTAPQQPQQPPPGYGYPQAPGQPGPYGQPQQPFPPQPGQGGGNRTKIIAIATAAVVVVGALVVGAVLLTGGGDDTKAMKLVTPKNLDNSTYKLDKGTEDLKNEDVSVQDNMPEGATSVLARYVRADDANSGLVLSGAYGEFSDPGQVQDQMFAGFRRPGLPRWSRSARPTPRGRRARRSTARS